MPVPQCDRPSFTPTHPHTHTHTHTQIEVLCSLNRPSKPTPVQIHCQATATSFRVLNYSAVTLPLNAIQSGIQMTSLHEPHTQTNNVPRVGGGCQMPTDCGGKTSWETFICAKWQKTYRWILQSANITNGFNWLRIVFFCRTVT
jgi:hypothetical protein